MKDAECAYAAGLIDALGVLSLRVQPGTLSDLPSVVVSGNPVAVGWLAARTGTSVVTVKRDYTRHRCTEHCPEAHDAVKSLSSRWSVTGTRATIVLYNVLPFLTAQHEAASELVAAGLSIGWKGQVVEDMKALGWVIPTLKTQPRARPRVVAAV